MDLRKFSNEYFDRGANRLVEALWIAISGLLVSSWLPGSSWRRWLLRLFGAKIGHGVVIKPHVSIKFPWRLVVEDHVWIGERVWIDNLDHVSIGRNTCLSQGAYLCTGSHNWRDPGFGLITEPISVGSQCWICAQTRVGPGTSIGDGTVVSFGMVVAGKIPSWSIVGTDYPISSRTRKLDQALASPNDRSKAE